MLRSRFQQSLDELRSKLLAMAGLAENAVEMAIRAYSERVPELCQKVMENETTINLAERKIDEMALDLLAMQQPMAVDLRFILAVLKINADMIALPYAELAVDIPQMGETVGSMIRQALEAFVSGDAELAHRVLEMDDIVDRMNQDIFVAMDKTMSASPELIRQALDTIIIARNLERIADHAVNIAERVNFMVTGEFKQLNKSGEKS